MRLAAFLSFLLLTSFSAYSQNLVTYAGNKGDERFNSVVQLSDQTYLVAGVADDLNWLPSGTPTTALSTSAINNAQHVVDKIGFVLHLSSDLQTINRAVYFPAGGVQDIRHIKTDNVPGSATKNVYISGKTEDTRANGGGYFLAKLNNNFVSGAPTDISWAYNVYATGYYQEHQPWDVGSDGKILFVAGQPYGTDSCTVLRLKADGSGPDIVDQWRYHYGTDITSGATVGGHWSPANSNLYVQPVFSALHFRTWTRCELRSWSSSDYSASTADGNGGTRQGKWPLDMFFSKACDTSKPGISQTVPGYTGYSMGGANTLRVGAIAVDRRTNAFYIGASTQAFLPSGFPDQEPFVMAFSKDGNLKWWSRLHEESSANSPVVQQVSAMTIDYSASGTMGALAVVATTGGKVPKNLWEGDDVQNNPQNPGYAFHNKYTGTDTLETISWLGRLRLTNGELLHSTYVAAYSPIDPLLQAKYTEPIHDNWASHNAGNPSLDETTADINIQTDFAGRIYLLVEGSRLVTTSTAYQPMVKPSSQATTAYFICVFEQDLTKLAYCSALTGQWSTSSGGGGDNTVLHGVFPVHNGAIISGYHTDKNQNKVADGNSIPLARIPGWGDTLPQAEEAILARLLFDTVIKAAFYPDIKTGTCTNTNVTFTDTSYNATSWSWDFGSGATPGTATGKGPHTVSWSTADTVEVKLVVSDGTNQDSMILPYIITSKPSSSFTNSGNTTSAPDTISFNGPSGSGLTYAWDFGDTASGGLNYSTEEDPVHIYTKAGSYTVTLAVTSGNCSDTSTKTLNITGGLGDPDPAFTFTPADACTGGEVIFTQQNAANSVQWFWVFGNDAVPRSANTKGPHSVKYGTPGPKNVSLTVSNGVTKKTSRQNIRVFVPPAADFTYTGNLTAYPTTLIFFADKCDGCTYSWDFGDPGSGSGNFSSSSDTTHEFRQNGNYWVTLTVTDTNGCATSINKEVVINGTLLNNFTADFTVSMVGNTCVNNRVKFTDMSRSNTNSRNWYFGQDAVPSLSLSKDTVSVYWTTPGIKKVVMLASPGVTNVARQKSILYEVAPYPSASFTYTGETGSAPATVSFEAVRAAGYQYRWNFGDPSSGSSNTATGSNPTHVFSASGKYNVTLAVTRNGCTSYYVKKVYIGMPEPAIVPAFIIEPTKSGCESPFLKVTDASTGAITTYSWNFGTDATPASASTSGPHTIVYGSSGNKTITLAISNGSIVETASIVVPVLF